MRGVLLSKKTRIDTGFPGTEKQTPDRTDALLAELLEQVNALRGEQQAQRDRLAVLEAGVGLRDHEDHVLVLAFVAATEGRSFSAAALWKHADVDPVLAGALEAAGIDSPMSLGWFLKRVAGHPVAGWQVERLGASREGIRWRLRALRA
jgi:hypothetical protein